MKKISTILTFVFSFIVLFAYTGCSCKKNNNTIRVNEVTHSIFYAPLYVAINNGYFKEEGITIKLTNGGGSDASMTSLLSGSADIALMGPETVVYVVNQGKQDHPVVFGQLTKKDGSFLVGRNNESNFDWSNLNGKHFIAGRKGGSPAMSLQCALENKGYNIKTDLNFDLSIAFNMTVPAFTSGVGDYVTVFEPTASELVRQGKGYIVDSVSNASGEIPFTSFCANQSYLTKNKELCEKFLKAVTKGYEFLKTANDSQIVISLKNSFPDSSDESIIDSVKNYIKIDAWCDTPVLSENLFNNLINMLNRTGELSNNVDYNKVVNNSIAKIVSK